MIMLIFKAKDEILYIPKLKSKAEEVFQCILGFGGFFFVFFFVIVVCSFKFQSSRDEY